MTSHFYQLSSLVSQLVKNPPVIHETLGSIPGLGRSPGEGKGYPLQCSGLENCMDCIVHRVTKSWTRLSDFCFHFLLSGTLGKSDFISVFQLPDLLDGWKNWKRPSVTSLQQTPVLWTPGGCSVPLHGMFCVVVF